MSDILANVNSHDDLVSNDPEGLQDETSDACSQYTDPDMLELEPLEEIGELNPSSIHTPCANLDYADTDIDEEVPTLKDEVRARVEHAAKYKVHVHAEQEHCNDTIDQTMVYFPHADSDPQVVL